MEQGLTKIRNLRKSIFDVRLNEQDSLKHYEKSKKKRDLEFVKTVYFFSGIILGILILTYLILLLFL